MFIERITEKNSNEKKTFFSRIWILVVGCILPTEFGGSVEIKCDRRLLSSCYVRQPVTLMDGEELHIAPIENEFMVNRFEIVPHSNLKTFPHQIFHVLPHVEAVTLTFANIRALSQESFRNASNLQTLDLSANNMTALPKALFKNAPQLERLILAENQIAEIEDGAFSGLTKLQTLKLNGNRLKVLRSETFDGLVHLEFLHLYRNHLETVEMDALTLPNLTEVFFGHNKLTVLPADLFDGAPNLRYADFSNNQLQRIGNAFAKCDNLLNLNLENNRIADLDLSRFASMKSLAVLSLNNTKIILPPMPAAAVQNSPMQSLNLANNQLKSANLFEHLAIFPNLERLYLYNNEFDGFEEPHQIKRLLPKLNTLDLNGNKLISAWLQESNDVLQRDQIDVLNKGVL